jgi:hypothetical protein
VVKRAFNNSCESCRLNSDSFIDKGSMVVHPLSKVKYDNLTLSLRTFSEWEPLGKDQDQEYKKEEIFLFNDKGNFYPWQKSIYDQIFDEYSSLKRPHPRHIISILNFEGNKGKSAFLKYLCYKNPNKITKLSYGISGQLRSAAIDTGIKKVYFLDLPRTRDRNDNIEEILSVTEDIKNGFLFSIYYGKSKKLFMNPPFGILFTNRLIPDESLSEDHWASYRITDDFRLKEFAS